MNNNFDFILICKKHFHSKTQQHHCQLLHLLSFHPDNIRTHLPVQSQNNNNNVNTCSSFTSQLSVTTLLLMSLTQFMHPSDTASCLDLALCFATVFLPLVHSNSLISSVCIISCASATSVLAFYLASLNTLTPIFCCFCSMPCLVTSSVLFNRFCYYFVSSPRLTMSRQSFCPATGLICCFQPNFFYRIPFIFHNLSFS